MIVMFKHNFLDKILKKIIIELQCLAAKLTETAFSVSDDLLLLL